MRARLVTAATLALSLAACSDPTLPPDRWVRARAQGDATVAVTSLGSEPVYFRVVDPTELALLPSCTAETCTRLGPGETVEVPYSQIVNYEPGDAQASVTWWFSLGDGGGVGQGSVIVDL